MRFSPTHAPSRPSSQPLMTWPTPSCSQGGFLLGWVGFELRAVVVFLRRADASRAVRRFDLIAVQGRASTTGPETRTRATSDHHKTKNLPPFPHLKLKGAVTLVARVKLGAVDEAPGVVHRHAVALLRLARARLGLEGGLDGELGDVLLLFVFFLVGRMFVAGRLVLGKSGDRPIERARASPAKRHRDFFSLVRVRRRCPCAAPHIQLCASRPIELHVPDVQGDEERLASTQTRTQDR